MLIRSLLLSGLVLFAACGKDEPAPKPEALPKADAQVRSTVATLAPADSAVLVQCASASKLAGMIQSMGETFGAETPPDPLAMMFASTGIDGSRVDQAKPMAFAASFPKEQPPTMTWILPFADAKAAAEAHEGAARFEGNYAALASELDLGEGGCDLADGLLAGDVSVRIDVSALVEVFRKDIDSTLQLFDQGMQQGMQQTYGEAGAQRFDAAGMSKAISDAVRTTLDSVETMDCVVNYGDTGRLDLDFAMNVKAGSPLDAAGEESNLAALAAHMQGDFPCVLFFRFDMKGYLDMFGGMTDSMVESMPEDKREGSRAYFDRSIKVMDHLTDDWAMGLDMSGEGFRAVMVAGAKDGDAYIKEYRELIASPELIEMGMEWGNASERAVNGTKVHSGNLKIDFVKYMMLMGMDESGAAPPEMLKAMTHFFGKEGMLFELAAKDDMVFMTIGGDVSLMDQALEGGKAPLHLEKALARVPGQCDFMMYLDFRGFMKGVWELVNQFGTEAFELRVPDGPPLPLVVSAASEGRLQRLGATLELTQLGDFFKSIRKLSRPR